MIYSSRFASIALFIFFLVCCFQPPVNKNRHIDLDVASVVGGYNNLNSTCPVTQAREKYKESRGMERANGNPETVALRPRASPCPAVPFRFLSAPHSLRTNLPSGVRSLFFAVGEGTKKRITRVITFILVLLRFKFD